MSPLVAGVLLAVTASVLLNGSYLLQHAGSQVAPAITAQHPVRTLRGLLASRWWLVGLAAGLAGWAAHVAALAHAPLSLVQAAVSGGLALTVPAAAVALGERLAPPERVTVAAMVLGLLLLGVGAVAGRAQAVPAGPMLAFLAAACATAAALAAARAGPYRARALAAGGGVLYGAADAATKAVTIALRGGVADGAAWIVAVLALSAGAFLCFQRALQLGPAVPVVAIMTTATNVVAVLGGVAVFGDVVGRTPALAAAHAAAFALVAVTALRLAAAQARLAVGNPADRLAGQVDIR